MAERERSGEPSDLQRLAARSADSPGGAADDSPLAREVHRVVRRYCRARLGRSRAGYAAADDVAARVAAAVMRDHRHELAGPRPIEALIYADMAAAVHDAIRSLPSGRNRWSQTPPAGVVAPASGDLDPVLAQLDHLPQRTREVLVLRAMVGLSNRQVGLALGLTPEVVTLEQQRALALLRRA